MLQVSVKAICLSGGEGFRYSIDLKEFAGIDNWNPQLQLAGVLMQSNALEYCFRQRKLWSCLVVSDIFSTSFLLS